MLKSYATMLQNDVAIEYDEQELKRLREQAALLESVTWSVVVMYLLRVFMPAILLLGLLYAIVALLKR